jgi:glutamine amidotransferase
MCRLTAYIGPEIPLENIIVKPKHSLLVQSQDAHEAKLAVNGDGFGIAWYGDMAEPGLYKDTFPAWSDENLPSICRLVKSRLFLAHVRASTEGTTSRENCHPFTYGRWSFMHNGGIGEFNLIRRDIGGLLSNDHYCARRGNTDSELFFLLMLTNGLDQNPATALERTIRQISDLARSRNALGSPVRLTCAFSNGTKIFGFRFALDKKSPSLYLSSCLDHGGRAIASEPLHGTGENWQTIQHNHLVELSRDNVKVSPINVGD